MLEMGHTSKVKDHVWNTPGYRPQEGEATHSWEFFLRDRDADKMSYVDKVVVYLHDTFPQPRRVLDRQPFVVKEEGYAGFVIKVEIYFKGLPENDKNRKVSQHWRRYVAITSPLTVPADLRPLLDARGNRLGRKGQGGHQEGL